ncbi:MAG: aldehyde dehydrogenase (NADP(+)) [Planctomycetota bacterium]
MHDVLINGQWRPAGTANDSGTAADVATFQATNPSTGEVLPNEFPVSPWSDCDAALDAASQAAVQLRSVSGRDIAEFLRRFASEIESDADALVDAAHRETGLAKSPRLADGELPRTTGQLRQAADAAETGSWRMATIDTAAGIRSCYGPLEPVCVFGPNNFPFAFGSASGGDFASAICAGNPVIAKANSSHPETTRLFAIAAQRALGAGVLPASTVQLLYRTSHADGARMVADPRVGACGYTGSRRAGLTLKAAADAAGKPIYLELSSVNPVVITDAALSERGEDIANQYVQSVLMGTGQFCTNPGVVFLTAGPNAETFIESVGKSFQAGQPGTLLSPGVVNGLNDSLQALTGAGAAVVAGDESAKPDGGRCALPNTLLRIDAAAFLGDPETFQTEAFGNAALVIVGENDEQLLDCIAHLEGNLTGCVYSANAADEGEEALAEKYCNALEPKVGRLLNDKMPTGVAVSEAMNHGGPYPATGHPGFTAVGIPASVLRFAKLTSYDAVRSNRLPQILRDSNVNGVQRRIDSVWTTDDVEK